ncbi:hypothetical protein TrispH2_004537 [Trichoplax sp. H2]|nr:hypothetical protein TrispH2_004537 [Trichoplax sp. H2]|eukprot:RDD44055.1 hypothetical protein TrispH2_004537 [Trichoplax sp. H2]
MFARTGETRWLKWSRWRAEFGSWRQKAASQQDTGGAVMDDGDSLFVSISNTQSRIIMQLGQLSSRLRTPRRNRSVQGWRNGYRKLATAHEMKSTMVVNIENVPAIESAISIERAETGHVPIRCATTNGAILRSMLVTRYGKHGVEDRFLCYIALSFLIGLQLSHLSACVKNDSDAILDQCPQRDMEKHALEAPLSVPFFHLLTA